MRTARRIPLSNPVRVWHPALLALQPALGLYATNVATTSVFDLFRPAVCLAGTGALLSFALRPLIRDKYRAGVVASIIMVALLSGWSLLEYVVAGVERSAVPLPWMAFNAVYGVVCLSFLVVYAQLFRSQTRVMPSVAVLSALAVGMLITAHLWLRTAFGPGPAALITVYLTVVMFGLAFVLRYEGDFEAWTQTLNWFGGVLLGLYVLLAVANLARAPQEVKAPVTPPVAKADSNSPDIYLIALEGYARPDILKDTYGYDAAPFLQAMTAKGFEVVPDSHANYALPLFSWTSCLNMGHLQDLLQSRRQNVDPFDMILESFHHNKVYEFLKARGYSLQVLAPGNEALDPKANVDVTLKPTRAATEFERVLARSTVAKRAVKLKRYLLHQTEALVRASFVHDRVSFAFTRLTELAETASEAPRFIFANLPVPGGADFAFNREGMIPDSVRRNTDPKGAFVGTAAECKTAYIDQVVYVNAQLERVVADIQKQSKRPAVILIASGTGPRFEAVAGAEGHAIEDRYSNLIMAYFPNHAAGKSPDLAKSMSLVNLFPETFNRVFNASLPLAPDSAYISTPAQPLDFTILSLH